MGGMRRAIERGYPQAEIQQQAYEWQRSVETGDRSIVGVNKFVDKPSSAGGPARDSSGGAGVSASHSSATQQAEKRADVQAGAAARPTNTAEAQQRERLEQYIAKRNAGDAAQPWRSACEKLTEMAGQGARPATASRSSPPCALAPPKARSSRRWKLSGAGTARGCRR